MQKLVPTIPEITRNPAILGGEPTIRGTRIGVADLVARYRETGSAVLAARMFAGVSVADVEAAMAYYHTHRDEIDAIFAADDAFDDPAKWS